MTTKTIARPTTVPSGVLDTPAISGAPGPGPALQAERGRPLIITVGEALRGAFDQVIARSSRVPSEPVLDHRLFPWTAELRKNWRAVRDEAAAVARRGGAEPSHHLPRAPRDRHEVWNDTAGCGWCC